MGVGSAKRINPLEADVIVGRRAALSVNIVMFILVDTEWARSFHRHGWDAMETTVVARQYVDIKVVSMDPGRGSTYGAG
jgi:hypothetical protein